MALQRFYAVTFIDPDFPERPAIELLSIPVTGRVPDRAAADSLLRGFVSESGGELVAEPFLLDDQDNLFLIVRNTIYAGLSQADVDTIDEVTVRHASGVAAEFLGLRVPVELSPLQGATLPEILRAATTGSWVTFGALYSMATFGFTPVGILLTPSVMIMFGASGGVAHALQKGLERRIRAWLTSVN